jgi:hypothetical protein
MEKIKVHIMKEGKKTKVTEIEGGSVFVQMGKWTYYFGNTKEPVIKRFHYDHVIIKTREDFEQVNGILNEE